MQNALVLIRKRKGLSVKEVCSAAGVKIQTYYKYEAGQRIPRPAVMLKLASALGENVGAIFFAEEVDYLSNEITKGA